MSKKTSKYQNDDGSFKEMQRPGSDHASAFNGCVLHMQHEEGHSEDSAQRICGAIAQNVAAAGDVGGRRSGSSALPDGDGEIAQAILAAPIGVTLDAAGKLPDQIQYMPPGRQRITPFVKGKPLDMEVMVTAKWADVFNAALNELLAQARNGAGDLPFTDFNHEDGAASSRPTEFYWGGDDLKTGGVRMRTAWTASGKSAVVGGDFVRFSPQWVFAKKTFEPLGLPVNVGGLVNRAAFRTIAPLVSAVDGKTKWAVGDTLKRGHRTAAGSDGSGGSDGSNACADCGDLSAAAHKASAKAATAGDDEGFNAHSAAFQAHKEAEAANRMSANDDQAQHHAEMMAFHKKQAGKFAKMALAGAGEDTLKRGHQASAANNNNEKGENMSDAEIATAMAKAFADPAFATAVNGVVTAALKPVTTELEALKKERKEDATARARDGVMEHVKRGAIAPEEKLPDGKLLVDYYTEQMVANAAATEMTLSRLPSKGPRRVIVNAGTAGASDASRYLPADPMDALVASAKDARTKRPQDFATDADALVAACRTKEGWAQYAQWRSGIVEGTASGRRKQFDRQRN